MKLIKMKLKNFRSYEEETFEFDDMTALIGKNDVGKSTVLEALDLFFNYDNKSRLVIKLDTKDLKVDAIAEYFEIICYFKGNHQEKIIIDSSNKTTLKDEYLLNEDKELEIHMKFDCSKKSLTKARISIDIRAYIPYLEDKEFITMKIKELKKELKEVKDEIINYDDINKTKKSEIRQALYEYYSDNVINKEVDLPIKDIETDNSNLWSAINKHLPAYFLFQSDRVNTSKDDEIQNPLKIALAQAIDKHEDTLEEIKSTIIKDVAKVGDATIEQLNDFDKGIAKGLNTQYDIKKWDSLFTLYIEDDRNIPLEKRGSGIRRLILLSYFRAEAERQLEAGNIKNIIYAIEEPETSQHPNYQIMIIDTFKELINYGENQVIITTHTPEIAKLLREEELIFIDRNENFIPKVINDPDEKKYGIKNSLGILPNIDTKLVICVEGENDISFLKNINANIKEFNEIFDLNNFTLIPMRGSTLQQWIDQNYLDDSNVREFHLYDSDVEKYIEKIEEMNADDDGRRQGLNTELPEMENYIPISLLEDKFNIKMNKEKNWKNEDIPKYLVEKVMLKITDINKRERAIKGILNKNLSKKITKEMLKEYKVYDEIKYWFIQMSEWVD